MKIIINNRLPYEKVTFFCNGEAINLAQDDSCEINTANNNEKIEICIYDKNKFYFDIINVLCGIFSSKDTFCNVYCNFVCDISSNDDTCEITLNHLKAVHKKEFCFNSVHLSANDVAINNKKYYLTDTKRIQKTHFWFQLLVASLLPLEIICLVLFILDGSTKFIVLALILALVFVLPSIRQIITFKKKCNNQTANNLLIEVDTAMGNQNSDCVENDAKKQKLSMFDKAVYKALDKITGNEKNDSNK